MPGRARLSLVWLLAAFGCHGTDLPDDPASCATDRDCPGAERCVQASAPDRPAIAACSSTCQLDGDCAAEYHCDPGSYGICFDCLRDCIPDGCAEGFVCQPDGRCKLVPCTDPGAPACPTGWRCDTSAPPKGGQGAKPNLNDPNRALRGCAQNPCGQSDGIECDDLWRCEPEQSTYDTGCVPLPCSDTGRCSDETRFICTPTNTGPRDDYKDPHGCVVRNCGEGVSLCSSVQICENGACRSRTCAEFTCPTGSHCLSTAAGIQCQVDSAPLTGGTGGTGVGSGGAGGSSSGAGGSAGTLALSGGYCESRH